MINIYLPTGKSFLNLVKVNQIWIVIIPFGWSWHQTEFRLEGELYIVNRSHLSSDTAAGSPMLR